MLKNSMISGPKCPACGDKKIVTDENTGEMFCGRCGFVVTDKIAEAMLSPSRTLLLTP